MRLNSFKSQQGQSLLELIVAIGVIVAGVLGTLTLIIATIQAGKEGSNRIIAQNLAREGIEIVRSIRDGNAMDPVSPVWDEGLTGGTTATLVVNLPNNDTPTSLSFNHNWSDDAAQIKQSGIHYLQGTADTAINFYRMIKLSAICRASGGIETIVSANTSGNDCPEEEVGLQVISEVHWPNATGAKSMVLEERLYNWR
jgi:Tfp pilus assembly protein PilV